MKLYNKPSLYVSLANWDTNSSSVYLIDLLSFEKVEILSTREGIFSKICAIYDKIFVGVNRACVLIYDNCDFGTPIGRIPTAS